MSTKQATDEPTIHVTARVPLALAEQFRKVAEAEHRTVSGELRRLMEQRVNGKP